MALLLGLATFFSTVLGGLFALKKQDKLHLILGFSAGAVIGVAFFDLLPEALQLGTKHYAVSTITSFVAVGFLIFMLLSRTLLMHPHANTEHHEDHPGVDETKAGTLGAISLSLHSLLDGVGIGLAFQVSPSVGVIVAAAVLVHDFSDGINTVSFVLKHAGTTKRAFTWLIVDGLMPVLGVVSTLFFTLSEAKLGIVLALFCGFFFYIGASDLLPESQHRHPQLITSILTILGALVILLAIRLAQI